MHACMTLPVTAEGCLNLRLLSEEHRSNTSDAHATRKMTYLGMGALPIHVVLPHGHDTSPSETEEKKGENVMHEYKAISSCGLLHIIMLAF